MGLAFVFVRRNAAILHAGHVGWGFQLASGDFFCGATENPRGNPIVIPGGDNGWWGKTCQTQDEMLNEMRIRAYNQYKSEDIVNSNPDFAYNTAMQTEKWGYSALGNNCLDHTYAVLYAYSVKNLPLKQLHITPNDWFDAFQPTGPIYTL